MWILSLDFLGTRKDQIEPTIAIEICYGRRFYTVGIQQR